MIMIQPTSMAWQKLVAKFGLTEAGELENFDDEARIVDAAISWAERWQGGSERSTDEAAKWDADWAHRAALLAGWQTLTKVAGTLIPGYKAEQAAEQFGPAPPPPSAEGGEAGQEGKAGEATYQGTPHWPSMLRTSKNGAPQANLLMNACAAFRHAPEWQGVLAQNLFSGNVDLLRPPPFGKPLDGSRPLDNITLLRAKEWLEINYVTASKEIVLGALKVAASDHAYHPVRAMLDSLSWDHVDRGDTWMIRHLGVEDTPLHRAYGARFLISMIARVRNPGCKADNVPILEGPQGQMKSALLRALADPWFTDHMPDLANKDAQLQLLGIWLMEFAEYGQLGRADANRAKNFVTIQTDRLRRPYEAMPEDHARQCVMVITLNPEAHPYLKDVTGNRRYWPVLCGARWGAGQQINLEAFRRERDQLLAEADYRYRQGEQWWLHEPDLIAAQEAGVAERVNAGPLLGRVAKAIQSLVEEGVREPSYDQVCASMGLVSAKDQSLSLQNQVGAAMTVLGWTRRRSRTDGVRETFYAKA